MIDGFTTGATRPTIADIKSAVAGAFGIEVSDLTGRRRLREYVAPRHAAMYLARAETNSSYPKIARAFNRKCHTTVMYACTSAIYDHLTRDPAFAVTFAKIRAQLAKAEQSPNGEPDASV